MCSDWYSCNFGGMGNKRTFLNWQGNFFSFGINQMFKQIMRASKKYKHK